MVNELHHRDCLDVLKNIPDDSIDLLVTDCPYRLVGGGCVANRWGGLFESEFLKSGGVFEHNSIEFSEWLPDVYRVLKEGTHAYIMINGRNLCDLQNAAEKCGFKFQNLLVWDKGNKTANRYYMQQVEFILMLAKGAARSINDMGRSNLISVPNPVGEKDHPTEKPVALMKILIESSSNKGEVVLDPFMGCGVTIQAAALCGRSYIGIEIDKKYFDIAFTRLKQQKKPLW